jgi:broad specificity phosphatase PhoE
MLALYLTHPEVEIDPAVPVPQWGLSHMGSARARTFAARGVVPAGWPIFSSNERKAIELAGLIAGASGGQLIVDERLGENDRTATGFLPPAEFEALVERFFADPSQGPDGWESANDAQQRIVGAVLALMERVNGPAVFCGHGGVGTLLKCWAGSRPIAREEDQRVIGAAGGGNCILLDNTPRSLLLDWVPFEAFTGENAIG